MPDPDLTATRTSWHGIAELVMAGPQFRRTGTIRLRPTPGGIGTVKEPAVRIDGAFLVVGSRRLPLTGTIGALAEAAGVDVGAPGNYTDGSHATATDEIDVDADAAGVLAGVYALADAALRQFAPAQTPVVWPEHFDVSIAVDEVNFGVSPGDSLISEPYAYVGPPEPRKGAFWTQPFGAAVPVAKLGDVDSVVAFFTEGRERARLDPPA